MGVTGYLLAWWLHARSRIAGGLRRRCKVSDSARTMTAQEAPCGGGGLRSVLGSWDLGHRHKRLLTRASGGPRMVAA
ncbi:hypothetical protein FCV25MIE_18836 [Fagus crenata]